MKPVISHSETDAFLTCEYRHYYAHVDSLEKIEKGSALTRGIIGHAAFEAFFKARQNNMPWMNAVNMVTQVLTEHMMKTTDPKTIELLGQLAILVPGFLEHFKSRIESWKVVAVEEEFRIKFEDFDFALKPDYFVREKNGEYALFDSKFTYDFYSPQLVQILPQLPKYAGALKILGNPVDKAYYSFIRYRNLRDMSPGNIYQMTSINLNDTRVRSAVMEQIVTARRILELKQLGPEEHKKRIVHTSTKVNCQWCPFLDLCVAEVSGSDGKHIKRSLYQPNTYGYEPGVMLDV